jgi:hypothetical protein
VFLTDLAHVTCWDSLGWSEPYSLDAAISRRRQYARTLGQNGV